MAAYYDSNGRYTQTEQRFIPLPMSNFWLAAGTPLAAFADGAFTPPGLALANSKAAGVRWNNHATPDEMYTTVHMPPDRKPGSNMTLHVVASKVGATLADAVTFTVAAYNQVVGALHDADANFGGASSAMVGNAATKTVQECTLTLASADLGAEPTVVTLSIQPTDGTLSTDDVVIHGISLEYERIVTAT